MPFYSRRRHYNNFLASLRDYDLFLGLFDMNAAANRED